MKAQYYTNLVKGCLTFQGEVLIERRALNEIVPF